MDENNEVSTEEVEQELVEESQNAEEAESTADADDWDDIDLSDAPTGDDKAADDVFDEEPDKGSKTTTAPKEEAPQKKTFHLKHLDEEKDVDEDEAVQLAQKGMDYDRIRGKYDELNTKLKDKDLDKLADYEEFIKELAENSGQDVESMMDKSRARMLVNKEAKNGNKISEDEALGRIKERRRTAAESKQKAEEKPAPSPEDLRKAEFQKFIKAYPKVEAKSIPQSVWDDFSKTGDLTGAYGRYENQQLREENEKLKKEQKNRGRSTGSRQSSAPVKRSKFDELWYDGT